jgi:hypothetical protein
LALFVKLTGESEREVYVNLDAVAYVARRDAEWTAVLFPGEKQSVQFADLIVRETPEEILVLAGMRANSGG